MSYRYSCFISYKRPPQRLGRRQVTLGKLPPKHLWLEFAEAFQYRLDQYLTVIPSFRDDHLQPGDDYPRELATSLCQSACLVALVVPEYFESAWCKTEWAAMASWEKIRTGNERAQLIFPIICTGDPSVLRPKFGSRLDIDLRDIVSPTKQMSSIKTLTKIRSIAEKINSLAKTLPSPLVDCDAYSFGVVGPDVSTPEFGELSPFGR